MINYMRSNDTYLGLPHDVFEFTMLQELVARSVGVEPGICRHMVGSLHLYDVDFTGAHRFLEEGFQSTKLVMPAMPMRDQWASVAEFRAAEETLRTQGTSSPRSALVNSYR
jgi:thymidylate synthase